jgi:hypothetical protein
MVDIDVACRANSMAQLELWSVANTKMNVQSSRSHSVFMLQLRGSNEESGTTMQGALNLLTRAAPRPMRSASRRHRPSTRA